MLTIACANPIYNMRVCQYVEIKYATWNLDGVHVAIKSVYMAQRIERYELRKF